MNKYSIIKDLTKNHINAVITTHYKPDGDAMGSMLGLMHLLQDFGHTVTAVAPSNYGEYLHWMPGNEQVVNYEKDKVKAVKAIEEADVIFCLDFNAPGRLHEMGDVVVKAKAIKVVIDHHTNPEPFYDHLILDEHSCATTQLLYEVITENWSTEVITPEIATCIYTGIITDTGGFRFPNVVPFTHRVTATLIEKGVNHVAVHRNLYDNNDERKIKFFGYCLSNKLVTIPECKTAYISVSHEEIQKFKIQTGETEGLVNYPLSLKGIVFAALIIDRGTIVKMSFRSIGDFSANEFAQKNFSGGGHKNAAGGKSDASLEETIELFREKILEHKSEMSNA